MRWEVTDALPGDAAPLARLIGEWVRETGWMPVLHTGKENEAFVAGLLETHVLRVARSGPDRLGFLARQRGRVQALHVAAGARGLGIGNALIDEVKSSETEISLWVFQANSRAIAFYRREGFTVAEQTDGAGNDERLPDSRMIWSRTG